MIALPVAAPAQRLTATPRTNYRYECAGCGAVMVATYPGDLVLTADRHGWAGGHCRRCRKAAS